MSVSNECISMAVGLNVEGKRGKRLVLVLMAANMVEGKIEWEKGDSVIYLEKEIAFWRGGIRGRVKWFGEAGFNTCEK